MLPGLSPQIVLKVNDDGSTLRCVHNVTIDVVIFCFFLSPNIQSPEQLTLDGKDYTVKISDDRGWGWTSTNRTSPEWVAALNGEAETGLVQQEVLLPTPGFTCPSDEEVIWGIKIQGIGP